MERTIEEGPAQALAWVSSGEGPPLLLINGYAATGADWDPGFVAGLAASFEVICPDNPGVGGSPLGAGEMTVDSIAAGIEALLDARGIERLPVVGWSMGGFVAQRLALRAPARVSALALLATDPGGAASVPAEAAVWSRLTDHSGTPREQAARLISLLFPPALAERIDAQFGEVVAAARAQLSPASLRAQEAAMDAWHGAEQEEPRTEARVLVVHGEEDVVIPAANAGTVAARWGAEIEVVAGGGHALMAQEPDRLAVLLRDFLF